ncbi:MAG TPA: hypothetical protein VGN07_16600 [Steroidobacteraceae bacterium]|jgi:hypothetical protein
MTETKRTSAIARCACGNVEFTASGLPITCAVCYCDDCQEGSRQIEALPNAGAVRDSDGGTAYVIYRKDRVRCSKGAQLLRSQKIKATSATNRVVATCCNSAMILSFDDARHWVDLYRARLQGAIPPLQMRVCTRFASGTVPDDLPAYPAFSFKFVAKLLAARVAMLFS